MAEAYRVYGDESFRDACLRGAETVWLYGLLMKGPGLCHGVAGNGYALLAGVSSIARPQMVPPRRRFWDVYRRRRRLRPAADAGQPVFPLRGPRGERVFPEDLRESRFGAGLPLLDEALNLVSDSFLHGVRVSSPCRPSRLR